MRVGENVTSYTGDGYQSETRIDRGVEWEVYRSVTNRFERF